MSPSIESNAQGIQQAAARQFTELVSHQQEVRDLQFQFGESRLMALKEIGGLIQSMMMGAQESHHTSEALFSKDLLDEFAYGSVVKCFGKDFLSLDGRKYPRIPNGDLLLMSRVKKITGKRFELSGGSEILAEFDVSGNEWFITQNTDPFIPLPILLEIALQPCGFLSAYLGTMLTLPKGDLFFRNLDGDAVLHRNIDASEKTLQTRAILLSSISSGGTVIQRFTFEISCQGENIFSGQSVFGYFSKESLASQSGLDQASPSAGVTNGMFQEQSDFREHVPTGRIRSNLKPIVPSGNLRMVDEVTYQPDPAGGIHSISASRWIRPGDWYFACHFYQDPVMPGSLGIESAYQALIGCLYTAFDPDGQKIKMIIPDEGQALTWKYRGQILPETEWMKLEIKPVSFETIADQSIRVKANASVWSDYVWVYEIKNLTVRMIKE